MGQSANDTFLSQAHIFLQSTGTLITVCTTNEPTNYLDASSTTGYMLATTSLASTDYTLANGDTNGRKVTIASQADITVANSGVAGHVTICSTGTSTLLLVTTCTTQSLTSGNTVTIPAFDDEIADPTTG
jgi:hypothetical protein